MSQRYDTGLSLVYNAIIILRPEPEPEPFTIEAELSVPSTWRGWGWPAHITVKWDDEDVSYRIRGEMTDDGPVLTEVHVTGKDLRPTHMRSPLNGVMRGAFAKAALGERPGGGFTRREGMQLRVPVGIGRPIDVTSAAQRLDEVARIATAAGHGKRGRAVAEHFKISMGWAYNLITEARKRGYMSETEET